MSNKIKYYSVGIILCICGLIIFQIYRKDSVVIKYFKNDSLYKVKDLEILINQNGNNINYIYKQKEDTLMYSFSKSTQNDSLIFIYSNKCSLVSSKTYRIDDRDVKVFKYYFQINRSCSGKRSLFYQNDCGILLGLNEVWGSLAFSIESNEMSKKIIDSIVNDKTDFFIKEGPSSPLHYLTGKWNIGAEKIILKGIGACVGQIELKKNGAYEITFMRNDSILSSSIGSYKLHRAKRALEISIGGETRIEKINFLCKDELELEDSEGNTSYYYK